MTRSITSARGHEWSAEFEAGYDGEPVMTNKVFLNNHRVYPTERRSATLWKRFNEEYDLGRELADEKFDRYAEY